MGADVNREPKLLATKTVQLSIGDCVLHTGAWSFHQNRLDGKNTRVVALVFPLMMVATRQARGRHSAFTTRLNTM